MISLPLGTIVLLLVTGAALNGIQLAQVLNLHSVLIVFLGTAGVLALSTPMPQIVNLMRCLIALFRWEGTSENIHATLLSLSRDGSGERSDSNPLISYAQGLWQEGVDDELFKSLLSGRMSEINARMMQAAATMRNLAKYPPALGMTGTVVGLVSIFSRLGGDNRAELGPSLALAMTATFYGLVLANMALLPLADRLQVMSQQNLKLNEHIYRVLLLIQRGEPTQIIEGQLRGNAA